MTLSKLTGETVESRLFWSSVLLLFGEILAIRWLTIEVPTIRVFSNLVLLVVLVAASAGVGDPQKYKAPVPYLLGALSFLLITVIFAVPLHIPSMSINFSSASPLFVAGSVMLLLLVVTGLLVIFVNVGGVMGSCFSQLKPLRAYSINLLGSIFGVALVAMISLFQLPPPAWLLICGLITYPVARTKLVLPVTAIAILAALTTTMTSMWSPYSKLDMDPIVVPKTSVVGAGNYVLNSNNHYFHFALRMLTDEEEKRLHTEPPSPQLSIVQHYLDFLRLQFECAPHHDSVLVLGGGSGNDAAFAIAHGAKHVDVVEIDPIISRLGKTAHPNRPYADPRVSIHTEDARTFLRYSKNRYDLIEFAYLDPGNTLNTASFVRVDNFVYTQQSVKSAIDHLNDSGLLTISFATGAKHPVTRRLYQTIAAAQGSPPMSFVDDKWDSVLFLIGPQAAKAASTLSQGHNSDLRPWPQSGDDVSSTPSTDDWPFLYLEYDPVGTCMYFAILIVSVIFPAFLLTRSGSRHIASGAWGNMFFLGQAFMLVETKSIAQLSLFFGATWIVSSVVIGCVLVLAFIANLIAGRLKPNFISWAYLGLAAALLLDLFFKVPMDSQLHPLMLASISTLIACLPILFGGLIFSLCFRQAANPSVYLSANLLGVAVGGLTENLCIVTGIKGLVVIAMILYAMSYISLRIKPKSPPAPTTT